eukprot:TRINITY_DN26755_c0_g1_i1.p1 TRINITY_DN26755_c0_g1~~TRINITY_DN26755_c0_g1_i1.p1  ORF type:complete len:305 (-),score=62.99 TRINITY_DN26755_c0_g1_i1:501-1415(-)
MATIRDPPPFQEASTCAFCNCTFTTFRRRHHCRGCGKTVCADHSNHSQHLPEFGLNFNVRICDGCFGQSATDGSTPVPPSMDPLSLGSACPHPQAAAQPREGPSSARLEAERPAPPPPDTAAPQEDSFSCSCGMPLCICERPARAAAHAPLVGSPSAAASLPSPKPRRASVPPPAAIRGGGQQARGSGGSGLASLGSERRGPAQQRNYEASGEGMREAVKNADVAGVQALLQQGIDPLFVDRQGMSLLHLAALFNHRDIAFLLMDAGAKLDARNPQGETAADCAPAMLAHQMREKAKAMEGQLA